MSLFVLSLEELHHNSAHYLKRSICALHLSKNALVNVNLF